MKKETKSLAPYAAMNCHQIDLHESVSHSFAQALQTRPELRPYALVDTAFNERLIKKYKAIYPSVQPVSLYSGTELDELSDISPILIPLSQDAAVCNRWATTLLQLADGVPMLSFLASSLEPHALAMHFSSFLKAETEDRQRFLLRFADTRILPVLIDILDSSPCDILLHPIAHWWSIDRMGKLQILPLPKASSIKKSIPPLAALPLTDQQFAALIDAAEADAIIEQLLLIVPEQCATFEPGNLHLFIAQQLEFANRFGIESTPDRIAYCIGAFNSRGKLHENPHALALFNDRRWQPGDLSSALADLPEECWAQI